MKKTGGFNQMIITAALLISLCACSSGARTEASPQAAPPSQTASSDVSTQTQQNDDYPDVTAALSSEVVVSFEYEKQSGSASNQFAIWVEDMDGNYINTLFTTKWTAGGGYKNRPDAIPLWVEKSNIALMPDYYTDAVSGATPKTSGLQSYTWNLKDINGETVSDGEYRVFVEGTLRWKNRVIYSGVITVGGSPATIQTQAEYIYQASDKQDALTNSSPENAMLGEVKISFVPGDNN